MQILKQSTSVKVVIGPVVAVGDGFTPVTGLSLSTADEAEVIKHDAAAVTSISGETMTPITSADGYYNLTLTASLTDTVGMLTVLINDDSLCLPVKATFHVVEEAIYDSLFASGADGFDANKRVNVGRWLGTAVTTSSTTSKPEVDVFSISDDATAANNAELAFDGTGYGFTGCTIPTVTTLTGHTPQTGDSFARIGVAGAGLTAIPWNLTWDAEVADAVWDENIVSGHGTANTAGLILSQLTHRALATNWATDITANSALDYLADDGTAVYDRTTDSLQAIRDRGDAAWVTGAGGSDRLLMVDTTINTLASQTSFTLVAGSADNDAYNGCTIVIEDATTSTQKAVGIVDDYVGATKTVTLLQDPGIYTMAASDKVYILAEKSLKPTTAQDYHVDVSAGGAVGVDWANVEGPTSTVGLTNTTVGTVTTLTGHTAQTGDSFARLGAPAGASVSADIAAVKSDTASILVDTAEIGTAGAGLTNIPWNASWDVEVESECNDALVALHLDHLLAVDYDPATKPGVATALLNELVENDGGVSRYTANALEQAPSAGTNPNVLVDTTAATVATQTSFTLTAGSNDDDAYNDQAIVIYDADDSDFPSVRKVSDYVGSTRTVTLDSAPDFTMVAGDGVKVFVTAPGTTAPTAAQIADAVWDETSAGHTDAGKAGQQLWTDLDAVLVDTAEIGAAGAGLSAVPWNVAWDAEVESECTDALNTYDPPTNTEMTSAFTEIKGATWSSVTDTLEAIRDQGDAAWITATSVTVSDKTGFSLSAAGIDAIWDELTSGHVTAGSFAVAITDVLADTADMQPKLGTPAGASMSADIAAIKADTAAILTDLTDGTVVVGTINDGAIGAAVVADIFSTTTITEAYAADGAAGTPAEILYQIQQALTEFAIASTTITVKKLDGTTTASTYTLDSDTTPTSRTRAT